MGRKNKGWRNEPIRHSLAAQGIKTKMEKIMDDKRRTLPNEWIENRIERQPFRQKVRDWASEYWDTVQEGLEEGDFIIDETGRLKEVDEDYDEELWNYPMVNIDYMNFTEDMNKDDWADFTWMGDEPPFEEGNVVIWVAQNFAETIEPIREWLKEEKDIELDVYCYALSPESVGYQIDIGKTVDEMNADRESDVWDEIDIDDFELWGRGTGEFDLQFLDYVAEEFTMAENKRDFKNRVVNIVESEIELLSKKFYKQVNNALKNDKFDEFVEKREEALKNG